MKNIAAVLFVALLGCRAEVASQADNSVLCSLDGKAFWIKPNAGDTSFVFRAPTADKLCNLAR